MTHPSNAALRQTADQLGLRVSEPYRVGIGWELDRLRMHLRIGKWAAGPRPRRWKAARRSAWRILRRLPIHADWGLWQSEATHGVRRGPTARVAERRMLRDEINAGTCYCANPYPCPTIRALDGQEPNHG